METKNSENNVEKITENLPELNSIPDKNKNVPENLVQENSTEENHITNSQMDVENTDVNNREHKESFHSVETTAEDVSKDVSAEETHAKVDLNQSSENPKQFEYAMNTVTENLETTKEVTGELTNFDKEINEAPKSEENPSTKLEYSSKPDEVEKLEDNITKVSIPTEEMEKEKSPLEFAVNKSNQQSPGIQNSLGLSLLATEYATSEESEEDSTSSEEDSEDNNSSDSESENVCPNQQLEQIRSENDTLENIAAEIELAINSQAYRSQPIEIDSDTSSDSDIEVISQAMKSPKMTNTDDEDTENNNDDDDEENDDEIEDRKKIIRKKRGDPLRVKGELLLEDLPPIEDLHITVPEDECVVLGKIHSIIDQLILVTSIPGTIPFDIDTILFLDKGNKVLGKVFDVLGQVKEPIYCVRFNSNKQIKERCIEIGQTVYVAPKSEYTQFIILSNLMKIRGSDASWENDIEPPEKHLDYSDDEQEKSARRANRNRNRENDNAEDDNMSIKEENSDNESIRTDSTYASRPRRKRRFVTNSYQSGRFHYPQQQQHNPEFGSPNYPSSNNFIRNSPRFNRNPPPFSFNPNHSSWHNNFNPYQQFNDAYWNNPNANNTQMPYFRPPFPQFHYGMQQPFYPPTGNQYSQGPPPPPPPTSN